MLLDSNIIIYATQPEYGWLREFIAEHEPASFSTQLCRNAGLSSSGRSAIALLDG